MRLVRTAQLFRALSDRTRLRIMNLLTVRELTGTQLSDVLRAPRARVARHLRYLHKCTLVSTRHDGNEAYYALRGDTDPDMATLVHSVLPLIGRVEELSADTRELNSVTKP